MSSDEDLSHEELVEFYDARDLFLGWGNGQHRQNVGEGFRRLKASRHSEARYVCSLFPEGPPESAEEAEKVFEAQGENAVALCYAGIVGFFSTQLVKRAAELGHAYAMGSLNGQVFELGVEERFQWAKRGAEAGDRMAFSCLGEALWFGRGCETDHVRAEAAFRQSAMLGYTAGMRSYGEKCFSENDPERYFWMSRASQVDRKWDWWYEARNHLRHHKEEGQDRAAVLMMIGRMVKGHEEYAAWGNRSVADEIVKMHDDCLERAREAVMCWMLCARRLGLYKDVSLIVARMVWEGREAFI